MTTKTRLNRFVAGTLAGLFLCAAARADDEGPLPPPPPPPEVALVPQADAAGPAPSRGTAALPPLGAVLLAQADVPAFPPPPPPPIPAPTSGGSSSPSDEASGGAGVTTLGDIHPKLKLEARLDAGDVAETPDGTAFATGRDLYVKKLRFGVGGRLLARGKYSLLFVTEHLGQDARQPKTKLDRAYVEYAFADALTVRGGRAKLPLSRGSLLSSNDVFLRDPAVVDAMDDVFVDDTQLNLQLKGSLGSGVLSWAAAVAPGWQRGDPIHKTAGASSVEAAAPLLVARVELAVPGFAQPLEETRPGRGRRLSLGASYSVQRGIRYAGGAGAEDRSLASADLTARIGPFSAVAEADGWLVESTLPAVGARTPFGGYAQVAWFISGPRLEPAVRYEAFWDRAERGADQGTLSLGLNWYARPDRLKLAVEAMRTEFGPSSAGRLEAATTRTRVQVGADFSF